MGVLCVLVLAVWGCSEGEGGGADDEERVDGAASPAGADGPASRLMELGPGELVMLPPVPILPKFGRALSTNMVRNGGFEFALGDRPSSWSFEAPEGCDIGLERDRVAQEKSSLRVEVPGRARFEAVQAVKVGAQGFYGLRCLFLASEGAGELRLVARDTVGDGARFSAAGRRMRGVPSIWRVLELEFELPAFVNTLTVGLEYAPSQGGAGGTVWFDRCEMFPLRSPWGKNLIRNGDFTQGKETIRYWQRVEEYGVNREPSGMGLDLPTCIRVDVQGNQQLSIYQVVKELEPGGKYVLRGYIKTENLRGAARIAAYHPTLGWKAFRQNTDTVSGTQDWQWVRGEITVPSDLTELTILLRRPATADSLDTPGTAWFARVEFFRADEPSRGDARLGT